MKITNQLRFTIIGILIFAFGNLASVLLTATGEEGAVVNQAGVVRGGTQRLVKLELLGKPDNELIQKTDRLVNGLTKGDKELGLPPATDPNFLLKMQEVETHWSKIKDLIQKVRQNPQYQDELFAASETLFKTTNEAVDAAENVVASKASSLRTIQIIVFALNLIIVAAIWLIVRNITSTLQKFTGNIASSANEIAATIEQQERTIAQQASAVNETSTTMDELGASSRQSAEQAETSASRARQVLDLSADGSKTVQQPWKAWAISKSKCGRSPSRSCA